jgi:hypothetical protein
LGRNAFGVEFSIEAGIAWLLSQVIAETKTKLPTVSSVSCRQRSAGGVFIRLYLHLSCLFFGTEIVTALSQHCRIQIIIVSQFKKEKIIY